MKILKKRLKKHPQKAAEEATKTALSIMNGDVTGYAYKYHIFPHRLLTQDDNDLVKKLLQENFSK